jgi:hypothetical protein
MPVGASRPGLNDDGTSEPLEVIDLTLMSSTVRAFEALDAPHCAPTVIVFATVVSIVTVRDAATSGNRADRERRQRRAEVEDPLADDLDSRADRRTCTAIFSSHGHDAAPVPVVIADDAASATPATPP